MIIIGNILSFFAAIFTVTSSWQKTRDKIYGYQCIQCSIMAIASFFLSSYSGMTTFILCALRNYFLAKDQFDQKKLYIFLGFIIGIGIVSNNRGWMGYIPIVTTVLYTVGSYIFKNSISIKCNIIVNLLMWAIYEFYVCDYVSVIVDSISAIVAFASLFRKKETDIK